MNSPILYVKQLIRRGSRADSLSCRKAAADRRFCQSRLTSRHRVAETQSKHLSHDSTRESIIITKKDGEAFGFEIRSYEEKIDQNWDEDKLTCVCAVREDGPAQKAGLRTGDVIVSVNSVCVEGFEHQQIVDLIQNSCLLKMEILRGTTVKQKELQMKLHHLQWQLNEKRVELQKLIVQEEHLQRDYPRSTHPNIYPDLEHPALPIQLRHFKLRVQ